MSLRTLLTTLSALVVAGAMAEVVSVDVDAWAAIGTGETNGWAVFEIDNYSGEKGARFDELSDYVLSPEYSGSVTQLVMTVKPSSETTARFLTAIPVVAVTGAKNLSVAATKSYETQTLVWQVDEAVRRFQLQNATGSGSVGWGIRSLDVYIDRIEAPCDLLENGIYSDALSVSWTPDKRAVSNEVEIAGVITAPPAFNQLERWDFSVLTNATGSSLDFKEVPGSEKLTGVSGEYLHVQAKSGGYLQAGTKKGYGRIWISLSSGGRRTALMRLYRHNIAEGTDGTITVSSVDSAGVTNTLAEPFLTTQPHDFIAEISEDACELLIESSVKSRRIRVEDVKIVTDYVPGYVTTNAVPARQTRKNALTVGGLSPGDWIWHVRSFDSQGDASAWSSYRAVTIPRDAKVRGFKVIIR